MGDNVGKLSFRMAQGVLSVDFCGDSDLGQRAAGHSGVAPADRLLMPFLSGVSDDRFDRSAALMSLKSFPFAFRTLPGGSSLPPLPGTVFRRSMFCISPHDEGKAGHPC